MNKTYQDLKSLSHAKGFQFFENGDFDLNIYFERQTNAIDNKFGCLWHIAYKHDGIETVRTVPANSKPGMNKGIISMVCPGQYLHAYKWIAVNPNPTKEYPFNKEFFQLQINLPIWLGKDGVIDFGRKVLTTPQLGTNIHKQSREGQHIEFVNNWSLACLGAIEPEFDLQIPIIEQAVKTKGDIFSITIFESKDWQLIN